MPRLEFVGAPVAYAVAGLVVAIAFALGLAWSTEAPPRDEASRLAYARCLVRGHGPDGCTAERHAARAACLTARMPQECDAVLAAVGDEPALVLAAGPEARFAGPLRASVPRALRFTAVALLVLGVVLLARRPDPRRVARVAAGAGAGAVIAALPALLALSAGALLTTIVPGSDLVLGGFGLFVSTFVAVIAIPALGGAVDTGDARGRRVQSSLILLAVGTALWILLVGPIAGRGSVWLQGASSVALALAGYLARRPGL